MALKEPDLFYPQGWPAPRDAWFLSSGSMRLSPLPPGTRDPVLGMPLLPKGTGRRLTLLKPR
jgi:hypothetical protein